MRWKLITVLIGLLLFVDRSVNAVQGTIMARSVSVDRTADSIGFTRSGNLVVMTAPAPTGIPVFEIWDVASRRVIRKVRVEPRDVRGRHLDGSTQFSSDASQAADVELVSSRAKRDIEAINIWDVTTGKRRHRIGVDRGWAAEDKCFSSDGRYLAVVLTDIDDADVAGIMPVRFAVYDLWRGTRRTVYASQCDTEDFRRCVFSPDGRTLMCLATLTFTPVDLSTFRPLKQGTAGPSDAEGYSPDSRSWIIASKSGTTEYDVRTGKIIRHSERSTHGSDPARVDMSGWRRSAQTLVFAPVGNGIVTYPDRAEKTCAWPLNLPTGVDSCTQAVWLPSHGYIAGLTFSGRPAKVYFWRLPHAVSSSRRRPHVSKILSQEGVVGYFCAN
jgi:WD40 repeat protein